MTHILVQLPLLALAGAMSTYAFIDLKHQPNAPRRPRRPRRPGWSGLPLLLIAIFVIAYWMLPRSIDAVLIDDRMELLKFVTVPGLIGAPLLIGWRQVHPLLRGFLKAEAVSMLAVMAFLYTHAPIRICNAYLVADQERLGFGFLVAAALCAVLWTVPIFLNRDQPPSADLQAMVS